MRVSHREQRRDRDATGFRRLWDRWYYVPLITLFIISAVAAAIGYAAKYHVQNVAPLSTALAAGSGPVTTSTPALPEVCRPAVEQPAQQLWLTGKRVEAETVWNAHRNELAGPYVTGKNGYVFWNDVQAMNFSQAVGRRPLRTDEADQWYTYLSAVRDELASQSVPFYIVATPAKWDVYPHELPDWAQSIRGSSPLDQLLEQYPDLPIIDLRAPLREAGKHTPVYSRVNSHWTNYGASIGWKTIADCINQTAPSLGPLAVPASSGVKRATSTTSLRRTGFPTRPPTGRHPCTTRRRRT